MVAISYLRKSTDKQENSLDVQRGIISRYAESTGLKITAEYHETASGADADRLEMQSAIEHLQEGDVLIIASWDRLARDVELALRLIRKATERGASVHSAQGIGNGNTAADRMIRTQCLSMAQYERDMTVERNTSTAAKRKARGETVGRPAIGKIRQNGKDVDDPGWMGTVERVRALMGEGRSSREVARELGISRRRVLTASE